MTIFAKCFRLLRLDPVAGLKLVVIVLLLFTSFHDRHLPSVSIQLIEDGDDGMLPIFWLGTIVCVAALVTSPFLKNSFLRISVVAVLVLAFYFDRINLDITGTHLDVRILRTIWIERHTSSISMAPFAIAIVTNLLLGLLTFVVLVTRPRHPMKFANVWSGLPIAAMVVTGLILTMTKGPGEVWGFMPPSFATPVNAAIAIITSGRHTGATPTPINYDETPRRLAQHIVFIVDESVRGDYVGFNNKQFNNTPFLSKSADRMINFGVATSASNCSFATRLLLRLGLPQGAPGSAIVPGGLEAGLFAYAKKAGYKTILIDGWGVQEYMEPNEFALVDQYVHVSEKPSYLRDQQIAKLLLTALNEDAPSFVYVSKFGVHFPYELAYPAENTPSLLRNLHRSLVGYAFPNESAKTPSQREMQLQSYHSAITWSVDKFFESIEPKLKLDSNLIVYTSDHGQSLFEDGRTITHCSSRDPAPGESKVPLFVLTEIPGLADRLRVGAKRAYNHASHFEIFPTLLVTMGYDERWVAHKFGPTLADIPPGRHRLMLIGGSTGWVGPFNDIEWVQVD